MSTVVPAAPPVTDSRQRLVQEILDTVDVRVGSERAWDINVLDERFFGRVLQDGALGLGESYTQQWWDTESLDQLFFHLARLDPQRVPISASLKWVYTKERLFNRQRKRRAYRIAERHYDRGNDLFQAMLDRRMTYSCGYWRDADDLDAAQEAKLDLVCRKLGLRPGQTLLDIGCGWGSLIKYAAQHYGVSGVGITVSVEQAALGRELCRGLPVEIRVQDYRAATGEYDHVASIGMFEHVGSKNYRSFFDVVRRCLKADGLFLLHTIGSNKTARPVDGWIEKYIFPGGVLPGIKEIGDASRNGLVMEDWENFGADYDPTLVAWFANFDAAWDRLRPRYGDAFYRMWKYYLLSCAGSFRARRNNVWQLVFSKRGRIGGYHRPMVPES